MAQDSAHRYLQLGYSQTALKSLENNGGVENAIIRLFRRWEEKKERKDGPLIIIQKKGLWQVRIEPPSLYMLAWDEAKAEFCFSIRGQAPYFTLPERVTLVDESGKVVKILDQVQPKGDESSLYSRCEGNINTSSENTNTQGGQSGMDMIREGINKLRW